MPIWISATRAILFGAVGTAGQRCTTTRRIIVHESIRSELTQRLIEDAYARSPSAIRSIRDADGPVDRHAAVEDMQEARSAKVREQRRAKFFRRRTIGTSRRLICAPLPRGAPARILKRLQEETFAPILYIIPYREFDEAIA